MRLPRALAIQSLARAGYNVERETRVRDAATPKMIVIGLRWVYINDRNLYTERKIDGAEFEGSGD